MASKSNLVLLFMVLPLLLPNGPLIAQQNLFSHEGYVVQKNGEKLHGTLKLLDSPIGFGTTVLVDDSRRLSIHDFDSLQFNHHKFILYKESLHKKTEIRFKYHLLRELENGPITVYSVVTDNVNVFSKSTFDYFRTSESPLSKINRSSLSGTLRQRPESTMLLNKSKKYNRMSKIALAAGGAAVIYGMIKSDLRRVAPQTTQQSISPQFHNSLFVGLGFMVTSSIFQRISGKYFRKSIRMFNQESR